METEGVPTTLSTNAQPFTAKLAGREGTDGCGRHLSKGRGDKQDVQRFRAARPVGSTIALAIVFAAILLLVGETDIAQGQTPAFHDIRPGYGVTQIAWLSDYHPPLRGTPGDTRVYILDSGIPGGTAAILGGTHGNEISGVMAATVLVERAVPTKGRLIVIPHANNANVDYDDGFRSDVPAWFSVTTPEGVERIFRYGARRTNPAYETAPDPLSYSREDGAVYAGNEIRNLNRVHPGVPDGTLTEQIAYGIVQLLRHEAVDVAFDLHEAGVRSRIANTLVAHPRGLEDRKSVV